MVARRISIRLPIELEMPRLLSLPLHFASELEPDAGAGLHLVRQQGLRIGDQLDDLSSFRVLDPIRSE